MQSMLQSTFKQSNQPLYIFAHCSNIPIPKTLEHFDGYTVNEMFCE